MSKFTTAVRLLKHNKYSFYAALLECFNFLIPDKLYLQLMFRCKVGARLELKKPKTFCEKIQWLKLYDRNPLYTNLVDKSTVKEYVKGIIGDKHIIPTLGVWNNVEDIDYDALPNQFVLKTTNGSGGNDVVICNDFSIFNKEKTARHLKKSLKKNVYERLREWPYKNIKPRIIAEKYIEDKCGELSDYKFFCFDGVPQYCQVIRNRFTKETIDFFDMTWRHMPFIGLNPIVKNGCDSVEKPSCLNEMIEACKKLSRTIPFVRIDFYVVNNDFYFGEMTFYPKSGFGSFYPTEWNYRLGKMVKLPNGEDV